MKILIVEDDQYKSDAIDLFIKSKLSDVDIVVKTSLTDGVFEILDNPEYNIILLDMSMPSFGVSLVDPMGGNPESYAGEDFISQMSVLGYEIPIIVVTQYDNFGSVDKAISLSDLDGRLKRNYPNLYRGSVYFKSASNEWKSKLLSMIKEII